MLDFQKCGNIWQEHYRLLRKNVEGPTNFKLKKNFGFVEYRTWQVLTQKLYLVPIRVLLSRKSITTYSSP
jgi:hypothetical protein